MPESDNFLAFDTSTHICTAALRAGKGNVAGRWEQGRGIHSEKLFLFIDDLLKSARLKMSDIGTILFTMGPGSYTGLRIAASAVKGLVFGHNIDVYGVNTLAFFAESVRISDVVTGRVHSVIDARRSHLYHQSYCIREEGILPESEVGIREISSLESFMRNGDFVTGTGIKRLPAMLLHRLKVLGTETIKAEAMISLFDQYKAADKDGVWERVIKKVAPERFEPYYYGPDVPQVDHKISGE